MTRTVSIQWAGGHQHNDQKDVGDDQEDFDNDQEDVDNDQEYVNDDQEDVDNDQEDVKSAQEVFDNDQEDISDDQEDVDNDQEDVGDDQEDVGDDQEDVGDDQADVDDDQEVVDDDQEVVDDAREDLNDDQEDISDDQKDVMITKVVFSSADFGIFLHKRSTPAQKYPKMSSKKFFENGNLVALNLDKKSLPCTILKISLLQIGKIHLKLTFQKQTSTGKAPLEKSWWKKMVTSQILFFLNFKNYCKNFCFWKSIAIFKPGLSINF